MIRLLRSLTPTGIWVLAGLLFALVLGSVLLWNAWGATSTAKTEARLSKGQTGAALASGADAVEALGKSAAAEARIDTTTKENERAIRQAPGAAVPVDPDLHDLGLRSLCKRAAYRGRPECLQFAAAK
jgi:hypothetical protein